MNQGYTCGEYMHGSKTDCDGNSMYMHAARVTQRTKRKKSSRIWILRIVLSEP